ncbi:MAG: hypothetical protein WBA99_17630 [Nodosilinea sp.]
MGWTVGTAIEIYEAAIAVLFAFRAGVVILNMLKGELSEERQSWLRAISYAALLLAA